MKPTWIFVCLGLAAGLSGIAACGPARPGGSHLEKGAAADAIVVGTCLDAETGEKLSGVKIEGPGGTSTVSKRDGRFELRGLRAGQSGTLVAVLPDGRRADLMLRPLAAGTLEVVCQLAAPR
jgi:hypothetical protein